jgi:hypothetical protein
LTAPSDGGETVQTVHSVPCFMQTVQTMKTSAAMEETVKTSGETQQGT